MYDVVSLFCGCGGADMGTIGGFTFNKKRYKKNPCKLVFSCDIDQKAIDTYKLNFNSDEVICGDICELASESVPNCDILIGGFPVSHFQL